MDVEEIAHGQKMVIYAIVANFLVTATQRSSPELGIGLWIVAIMVTLFAIYGAYRLCKGLDYSLGITLLVIIALFIPFIGFVTLIALSMKATSVLRKQGYTVGLFGAK